MEGQDADTTQAHTVSIIERPAPDMPVRLDVAMRRRAAEYHGPSTPDDPGGAAWWRKVKGLASRA